MPARYSLLIASTLSGDSRSNSACTWGLDRSSCKAGSSVWAPCSIRRSTSTSGFRSSSRFEYRRQSSTDEPQRNLLDTETSRSAVRRGFMWFPVTWGGLLEHEGYPISPRPFRSVPMCALRGMCGRLPPGHGMDAAPGCGCCNRGWKPRGSSRDRREVPAALILSSGGRGGRGCRSEALCGAGSGRGRGGGLRRDRAGSGEAAGGVGHRPHRPRRTRPEMGPILSGHEGAFSWRRRRTSVAAGCAAPADRHRPTPRGRRGAAARRAGPVPR